MALIQTQPRRKKHSNPLPIRGILAILGLIALIALLYTLFKPVQVTTQEITASYSYSDFVNARDKAATPSQQ